MKTAVIIQARIGSTRLPGKVLKPLENGDVLAYVVDRCRQIDGADQVIVATTTEPQDDAIEKWCSEYGVDCFRGSEEDVLSRYIECAEKYDAEYVLRVTSDCPFVDYELAGKMIALMKEKKADIIDISGEMPRGLASELISLRALHYIDENGKESRHREHVTYYAYENHSEFSRALFVTPADRRYPELRITLDTEEDYELCRHIAKHFKDRLVPSSDVIQYLLAHPEIAAVNAHIEQKPVV